MDVLRSDQLTEDCQEVQLFVDGTWKSYDEDKASENSDNDKAQSNSPSASPGPNVNCLRLFLLVFAFMSSSRTLPLKTSHN